MNEKCEICGVTEAESFISPKIREVDGVMICKNCLEKRESELIKKKLDGILITTTNHFDGYCIDKYIDIVSTEIVIGTGAFSEFSGEVADFFGARSTSFEKKLQKAKEVAFLSLKKIAVDKDGNAVVGIDIDYTEFSGNRIGLIVNGTVVNIKKIDNN